MATSENESKADERFYTPRAQASTARSTGSYGTPRSYRSSSIASSSSDGEYATPRNSDASVTSARHQHFVASTLPRADRRNLIPPQHHHSQGDNLCSFSSADQTNHFQFDQEIGDEESRGEDRQYRGIGRENNNQFKSVIEPSKEDIESIFSYTRHGRIEDVDNLLSRGVPPDIRDDNGNSILAISCQNGNKRLAKLALRRGADINVTNLMGNTPLHFCFKYGNIALGQYLISKGADKTVHNLDGQTCEDLVQFGYR